MNQSLTKISSSLYGLRYSEFDNNSIYYLYVESKEPDITISSDGFGPYIDEVEPNDDFDNAQNLDYFKSENFLYIIGSIQNGQTDIYKFEVEEELLEVEFFSKKMILFHLKILK